MINNVCTVTNNNILCLVPNAQNNIFNTMSSLRLKERNEPMQDQIQDSSNCEWHASGGERSLEAESLVHL